MGLFKKKEGIPEIPASPSLPPLPSIKGEPPKRELPELPSFPTNSKNENLNQEMVKSAVADMPSPTEKEKNQRTPEVFPLEEPPEKSPIPELPTRQETSVPEFPNSKNFSSENKMPKQPILPSLPKNIEKPKLKKPESEEPIFIRIDKFQAAQKNFEEIKSKMEDIESVLKKIKKVREKEEEELKEWTEDTENLKNRLAEIDNDIFNKL